MKQRIAFGEDSDAIPVFLVHFDAPDWCRSAVMSLRRSRGADLEIVVIDNGGEPLGPLPCEVVRMSNNLGYAGGANVALQTWRTRFPRAPFAVIGSHDLHVDPHSLCRLLEAMASDQQLGVAGPVLVESPRSTGGEWRRFRRTQSFDASITLATTPVERSWLSGTCLMLRRDCVDAVGTFDEAFGSYMEDVDYCLRARDAGWKVAVVPGATAHGLGSSSSRSFELIARNRVRLLVKREGRSGALRAVAEALVRVPGLVARGVRHPGQRSTYIREAWSLLQVPSFAARSAWKGRTSS